MIRRLTLAAAFGLLAGLAPPVKAGFVTGSSVHATFVESGAIDVALFSGDAAITDPFREFAAFVYPDSFKFSTSAYANLSADTIQVGFSYVPGLGPPSVGALADFRFTFTGLKLQPGESITGLSLLANNRTTNAPFDYRTTADSVSIRLSQFYLGPRYGSNDDSVTFRVLTTTAPEPSSLTLCGVGLFAGLIAWGRRRRPPRRA